MANKIYLSEGELDKLIQEIKEQLARTKSTGEINIKKSLPKNDKKATIYFTNTAWNKLTALVSEFDTEVQWHGCVERYSENLFKVYDIIVPPHAVTGSTVTSDPILYSQWINSLADETFGALHFHGHSHVNMACAPSAVDMKYRSDIVTQLQIPKSADEDSYYIFLIFNKKGEWTGEIYDLKYNVLYETGDINIDTCFDDGSLLSGFVAEAKKMAVREVPKPVAPAGYAVYSPIYEAKTKKGKAQREAKQKKEKEQSWSYWKSPATYWDSDDEDDPTSPFYVRGD